MVSVWVGLILLLTTVYFLYFILRSGMGKNKRSNTSARSNNGQNAQKKHGLSSSNDKKRRNNSRTNSDENLTKKAEVLPRDASHMYDISQMPANESRKISKKSNKNQYDNKVDMYSIEEPSNLSNIKMNRNEDPISRNKDRKHWKTKTDNIDETESCNYASKTVDKSYSNNSAKLNDKCRAFPPDGVRNSKFFQLTLIEKSENMLSASEDTSVVFTEEALAQILQEDKKLYMQISEKFYPVEKILKQKKGSENISVLHDRRRYIYCFLKESNLSIKELYKQCNKDNVRKLAVPKIMFEKDWENYKKLIIKFFQNLPIEITVFDYLQSNSDESTGIPDNWEEIPHGEMPISEEPHDHTSHEQEEEAASWKSYSGSNVKENCSVTKFEFNEIKGDLFTASEDNSLAHCVAEDLRMGSGIAVGFRQQFKKVDDLLAQRKRVGQVAILKDKGRFVYYLITKKYSTGKPTLNDLKNSLICMKEHCQENNVKKLAIPKIGCGLDRLEWTDVKPMILDIFQSIPISISVYDFSQDIPESTNISRTNFNKVRIKYEKISLVEIESSTGILLICSEDSFIDNTMKSLETRFHFLEDFKNTRKTMGQLIVMKKIDYLYGLVVCKNWKDPICYKSLSSCLKELNERNVREDHYNYFGVEVSNVGNSSLDVEKFVTLLKNTLSNVEVWVCWPKDSSMASNYEMYGSH